MADSKIQIFFCMDHRCLKVIYFLLWLVDYVTLILFLPVKEWASLICNLLCYLSLDSKLTGVSVPDFLCLVSPSFAAMNDSRRRQSKSAPLEKKKKKTICWYKKILKKYTLAIQVQLTGNLKGNVESCLVFFLTPLVELLSWVPANEFMQFHVLLLFCS